MTELGYGGFRRLGSELLGWLRSRRKVAAPDPDRVDVVGHRGAPCQAPENTIASFETALRLGADSIETDICVTRDGRFVLWHDADPNAKLSFIRQAGGEKLLVVPDAPKLGHPRRKPVRELTLAQLQKHYGYRLREEVTGSAPRIPFEVLEDLLRWLEGSGRPRRVYLDLKLEEDQAASARALMEIVRRFTRERRPPDGASFHFLSIYQEIVGALLSDVREHPAEKVAVYADFERPGVLDFARRLEARCVGIGHRGRPWRSYRNELVRVLAALQPRGELISVFAWTVNAERELRELLELGTPAILTDEIERLRGLVDALKPSSGSSTSAAPPPRPTARRRRAPPAAP